MLFLKTEVNLCEYTEILLYVCVCVCAVSSLYPHLLFFLQKVAEALDFLSLHKYVHRDIAARNCLGKMR